MNIVSDICECIETVLELTPGSVKQESSSDDIEEWDSLGNLRIVMSVEEKYNIKFLTDEIPRLNSVAKLAERVRELLK